MNEPVFEDLGQGVYCVDALYTEPGLACCYLLESDGIYALIETGTALSVPNILAVLDTLDVAREQIRYVIPTHVHLDHAGGAGVLLELLPRAELLIHPRGARHMIAPDRLVASAKQVYGEEAFASLYGDVRAIPETRVREMADGSAVMLGSRTLRFVHTRGHAEHHFCVFDALTRGWFSGDMFGVSYPKLKFARGSFVMPATTPTQFDPAAYAASVCRLAESQPKCFYLTHFSRLSFDPAQADSLCRQLQAYAELGERGPEDPEALERAILHIAEGELARLTTPEDAANQVRTLALDAILIAPGFAWWRSTRSQA